MLSDTVFSNLILSIEFWKSILFGFIGSNVLNFKRKNPDYYSEDNCVLTQKAVVILMV